MQQAAERGPAAPGAVTVGQVPQRVVGAAGEDVQAAWRLADDRRGGRQDAAEVLPVTASSPSQYLCQSAWPGPTANTSYRPLPSDVGDDGRGGGQCQLQAAELPDCTAVIRPCSVSIACSIRVVLTMPPVSASISRCSVSQSPCACSVGPGAFVARTSASRSLVMVAPSAASALAAAADCVVPCCSIRACRVVSQAWRSLAGASHGGSWGSVAPAAGEHELVRPGDYARGGLRLVPLREQPLFQGLARIA